MPSLNLPLHVPLRTLAKKFFRARALISVIICLTIGGNLIYIISNLPGQSCPIPLTKSGCTCATKDSIRQPEQPQSQHSVAVVSDSRTENDLSKQSIRDGDDPNQLIRIEYNEQPSAVNQTWVNLRKLSPKMKAHGWQSDQQEVSRKMKIELLSHRRSEAGNRSITKVLLLAYMRGGSTFLMDLFNQHPNTSVVWYEALDSFYASHYGLHFQTFPETFHLFQNLSRRLASKFERLRLTEFLSNIVTLNIERLPLHTLSHSGFLNKTNAFKELIPCLPMQGKYIFMEPCTVLLDGLCTNNRHRINMTMMAEKKCNLVIEALRSINPVAEAPADKFDENNVVGEIVEDEEFQQLKEKVEMMVGKRVENLTAFLKFHFCVSQLEKPVRTCWSKEKESFSKINLVAAKLLRWSLSDLETLVQQQPDLHIIHLMRDPRAVTASRTLGTVNYYSFVNKDPVPSTEAKVICTKMRNDVADKMALDSKYPGLFLTIRYEEYLMNYRKTIRDIFQFVGQELPEGILEWFEGSINATQDGGPFDTFRANGVTRIDAWKEKISLRQTLLVNDYCSDILDRFGYMRL